VKMYLVLIEKAPHNFGAFSPDVPGCVSSGDTVEETVVYFREALQSHLEIMAEYIVLKKVKNCEDYTLNLDWYRKIL
jgi:predicted RNase H-like HicB family nuclease